MTTRGMGTGPMHCKKGVLIATERHLQKYLTQDIASQPMFLGIPNGSHGFKVMVWHRKCTAEAAKHLTLPPTPNLSPWQYKGRQDICSSTGVFSSAPPAGQLPPSFKKPG